VIAIIIGTNRSVL